MAVRRPHGRFIKAEAATSSFEPRVANSTLINLSAAGPIYYYNTGLDKTAWYLQTVSEPGLDKAAIGLDKMAIGAYKMAIGL